MKKGIVVFFSFFFLLSIYSGIAFASESNSLQEASILCLQKYFIFNGALITFIALSWGIPFGLAIAGNKTERKIAAWKLAHSAGTMGGILIITVALTLSYLKLTYLLAMIIFWGYIVSGYMYGTVLPLAAKTGHRGAALQKPVLNMIFYIGNMIASICALVASAAYAYATYISL